MNSINPFHCDTLCVVGVGLIGGSLARALRSVGAVGTIVGCGRDAAHLQQAVDLAVIDRYDTDLSKAVADADIIVLAVPLAAMASLLPQIVAAKKSAAIVTDVGSAKRSVIAAVDHITAQAEWFVPGHPIAGAEHSGVAASRADLFAGHRVILTPTDVTSSTATGRVRAMWEAASATVAEMTAEHHDEVLAATSHLPHVLAYALVDALVQLADRREIFEYAAGGFRDFTRIAGSDPVMWRDICLSNRDAILAMLDIYTADLATIREAIADGDGDMLLETFSRARAGRVLALQRMAVADS